MKGVGAAGREVNPRLGLSLGPAAVPHTCTDQRVHRRRRRPARHLARLSAERAEEDEDGKGEQKERTRSRESQHSQVGPSTAAPGRAGPGRGRHQVLRRKRGPGWRRPEELHGEIKDHFVTLTFLLRRQIFYSTSFFSFFL